MSVNKNVANAAGGKTARACYCCIKKRARWYCAADDAFLCQACDASVHSANPLARRHERVRLKTASSFKSSSRSSTTESLSDNTRIPSWHRGFTKKTRTPRKTGKLTPTLPPVVPEVGADDEISHEENEEDQLLYSFRVPIYDPFVAELCTSANSNEEEKSTATNDDENGSGSKAVFACYNRDVASLHGFHTSDKDLAEFAADVESLLGGGIENESFAMEELGLVNYREKNFAVKVEDEEEGVAEVKGVAGDINEECKVFANNNDDGDDDQIDLQKGPFELNFDYDSTATCGYEDDKIVKGEIETSSNGCEDYDDSEKNKNKRKILLSLDYEAVINAWASQGTSPWTTGNRPDFDPDERWPDFMGTRWTEGHNYVHYPYGEFAGIGAHPAMVDSGREARVLRYREKRRTRLFSKKIRYEVRKLNAEKRPRMKGRFVKRASFAGPPAFPLFNKNPN